MNETTQQEKTTQLSSRNEQLNSAAGTKQLNSSGTKQLNSSVGTKQLNSALPSTASTACNRLQPPTTACTAFTAESAANRLSFIDNKSNAVQPPCKACHSKSTAQGPHSAWLSHQLKLQRNFNCKLHKLSRYVLYFIQDKPMEVTSKY
ncbi:hypothetical protein TNCV_4668051 [Trichonephila clavipes]|nr:hypothetical protein TNCV_4668051 [Trichonephila clavipes]